MDDATSWSADPRRGAEFDAALAEHREWLQRWHRAMLCGLPAAPEVTGSDAARACGLGHWLDGRRSSGEQGQLAVDALDDAHALLHDRARSLAVKAARGKRIDAACYARMTAAIDGFDQAAGRVMLAFDRALSELDPLTGLLNRRAMRAELERERARGRRGAALAAVAIGDLDHFKQINDSHGHTVGDRVLQMAAKAFQSLMRPYDSVYRLGGEEFLFCLPNTDVEAAHAVVDRLRASLAACRDADVGEALIVTASFGIAPMTPEAAIDETIERADRALYAAKRAGRNRVVTWRGPVPIAVGAVA